SRAFCARRARITDNPEAGICWRCPEVGLWEVGKRIGACQLWSNDEQTFPNPVTEELPTILQERGEELPKRKATTALVQNPAKVQQCLCCRIWRPNSAALFSE